MATYGPNDTVSLAIDDGVAEIRLEDPDRYNVFSPRLSEDLLAHFEEVGDREDVSAVALTAEGSTFCAGLDLDIVQGDDPAALDALRQNLGAARNWLSESTLPVVTGATGAAPGAGAILLARSDIRVVGEDVGIWWPENQLGMKAYGEAVFLVSALGAPKATETILMGDEAKLTAEEAHTLGLVNRVVPAEDVDDTVREMAGVIAEYDRQHGLTSEYMQAIQHARREENGASQVYAAQLERSLNVD
ncbi:enoyl-CoA hydratase/isomerase family protein [Natrinema caseinilyticum]|uniref:enoyl-CoA hydratase/isomerase family protein n=1 Tax=Natrinema caseinilyticum TaxID=2961570 RepID=UPI0020C220CF|nr:enoyl-CoA hydratase/isomerase family protein [Natrinema caseinilyticum]